MPTKVTDDMIQRIFSLYLNCCKVALEGGKDILLDTDILIRWSRLCNAARDMDTWPILTPLSEITDEHAVDIARMMPSGFKRDAISGRNWANGKDAIQLGIAIDGSIDRGEAMHRLSQNFYGHKL